MIYNFDMKLLDNRAIFLSLASINGAIVKAGLPLCLCVRSSCTFSYISLSNFGYMLSISSGPTSLFASLTKHQCANIRCLCLWRHLAQSILPMKWNFHFISFFWRCIFFLSQCGKSMGYFSVIKSITLATREKRHEQFRLIRMNGAIVNCIGSYQMTLRQSGQAHLCGNETENFSLLQIGRQSIEFCKKQNRTKKKCMALIL